MSNDLPKDELVEELEAQVSELTDALQRERADALNIRRRHEEEKDAMGDFYKAKVLSALLPAIDNLELSLRHVPKELAKDNYVKGVQSVAKRFDDALKDLGLVRIETVGKPFNPHLHEAVHAEEGDGDKEIVAEELQAGWQLGDQVIRPAMVKVKKG